MAGTIFHNMRVAGIAGAVPTHVVYNKDFASMLGEDVVNKVINLTGISQTPRSGPRQTASDLGFVAAEKLLTEQNIDRSQIGAIIDITEVPDYYTPSTAFVLHKRLKLPQTCIAFDVN